MGLGDFIGKVVDPFNITGINDKKTSIPTPQDIWSPQKGKKGKILPSIAAQQATGQLGYYGQFVPQFLDLQSRLGPQIQAGELGSMQSYLTGTGGQMGILGLQGLIGEQLGSRLSSQRATELGQMTGQTGLTRGLMAALSPEQASAVERAQEEADRSYAASQGVTPQERRGYEQQAREAFQASGRLGGNAGIVAEAMGREDVMAAKRAEAAQAGQRAFGLAGQFYTQPGLGLLQRTPESYTQSMPLLSAAMQGGPASSGQFDYNMPINLALNRAGALDARALAQYQADQQAKAAQTEMFGNILGTIGSAAMFSDRRLKTDIKRVGTTDAGLPIYTYKYKGGTQTQMGVMAQDVEKVNPEAVAEFNGFKAVNYSLIS